MATPTRPLSNDYRECKLIKLDSSDPQSPMIVAQEGYAPGDPTFRMRVFYLQRDGFWIDEVARSTRPDSEAGDVVFESMADAVQVLSRLLGNPMIRDLPVTQADVETYLNRVRSMGSGEAALRHFLARFRRSKSQN